MQPHSRYRADPATEAYPRPCCPTIKHNSADYGNFAGRYEHGRQSGRDIMASGDVKLLDGAAKDE
jgi:hypothetical protein